MKLFGLTFRSPIVRYKDIDLEEDLYNSIRTSIIEDIVAEMEEETRHNIEVIKLFGPRP
jgi:acyl-ACP thioesterase